MFRDFLNERLTGEVMNAETGLKRAPKSQAHDSVGGFVEFGYGQLEPNHLSAQRNGKIYAQLPAAPEIEILEQGQFVKYDYAANDNGIGEVNFKGAGEWMLVYNETKLYRTHLDGTKQWDCEFAMIKDDYQARIYSPYDYEAPELEYHDWHKLNASAIPEAQRFEVINTHVALDVEGKTVTIDNERYEVKDNKFTYDGKEYELDPETHTTKELVPVKLPIDDVTRDVEDYYEFNYNNDPWMKLGIYHEKKMRKGTSMVPRVFKTDIGDLMTVNLVAEKELKVGDELSPRAKDGILSKSGDGSMTWQVVKVYTMPDGQRGVKVMRIK